MSRRSKYSVITAFALYGTPFLRRYPGFMLVVTTLSDPPRSCGPPRFGIGDAKMARGWSHEAAEDPCSVGAPVGAFPNAKVRVWVPVSVSSFSVLSSCQVM